MISQDAKVKNDRYVTLNVNCDLENLAGYLQGSNEAVYWKAVIIKTFKCYKLLSILYLWLITVIELSLHFNLYDIIILIE
jgi:hypothetical protein